MFRVVCQRDWYLCTLAAVKNVRTIVQLEFMLDSATTKQHSSISNTAMPARLLYCVTIIAVLKMQLSEAKEAFTMHDIVLDLKYMSAWQ